MGEMLYVLIPYQQRLILFRLPLHFLFHPVVVKETVTSQPTLPPNQIQAINGVLVLKPDLEEAQA